MRTVDSSSSTGKKAGNVTCLSSQVRGVPSLVNGDRDEDLRETEDDCRCCCFST